MEAASSERQPSWATNLAKKAAGGGVSFITRLLHTLSSVGFSIGMVVFFAILGYGYDPAFGPQPHATTAAILLFASGVVSQWYQSTQSSLVLRTTVRAIESGKPVGDEGDAAALDANLSFLPLIVIICIVLWGFAILAFKGYFPFSYFMGMHLIMWSLALYDDLWNNLKITYRLRGKQITTA